MKLINSSYEILEQGEGLQGIYEQIERVGKTCYKSEVKGGESAKKFVEKMIANQHYAMLEHGTVYLMAVDWDYEPLRHYRSNKYSRYKEIHLETEHCQGDTSYKYAYYVTTNLRVLVENGWLDDLKYVCEPTEHHIKRVCVRFICDRGVSHELVRHRVFSFAQESTRYCNYSKDKFGNELTFIIPSWAQNLREGSFDDTLGLDFAWSSTDGGESLRCNEQEACFMGVLNKVESRYMESIQKYGLTAQQARQMLPNALKTEVCMTGFVDDAGWKHFFDLRALDKTGPAHPDMKALALPLYTDFIQRGLINPQ